LRSWRRLHPKELLREGTMPLPPAVQTLPLFVGEKVRGTPIDLEAEFDSWLPVARAGTLVFWWVLLASGSWLARRWGGPTAAALAGGGAGGMGGGGGWARPGGDLIQIGLLALVPVFIICRGWGALDALRFQVTHNAQGHGPAFLLGEVRATGFWYYFPMTVLI